jgi:hypothetical protein
MTVYERTNSLLPRKRDIQIAKILNLVIPVRKMFPLRIRRMTSRVKKNAGPSQERVSSRVRSGKKGLNQHSEGVQREP